VTGQKSEYYLPERSEFVRLGHQLFFIQMKKAALSRF
jgi:hypothetical protein